MNYNFKVALILRIRIYIEKSLILNAGRRWVEKLHSIIHSWISILKLTPSEEKKILTQFNFKCREGRGWKAVFWLPTLMCDQHQLPWIIFWNWPHLKKRKYSLSLGLKGCILTCRPLCIGNLQAGDRLKGCIRRNVFIWWILAEQMVEKQQG